MSVCFCRDAMSVRVESSGDRLQADQSCVASRPPWLSSKHVPQPKDSKGDTLVSHHHALSGSLRLNDLPRSPALASHHCLSLMTTASPTAIVDPSKGWRPCHIHGGPAAHAHKADDRYEMRREAQEIIPGVFLGPIQASTNLNRLKSMGITHM